MYSHYLDDIALFGEMGFKCYRMSINWSRIFPRGDEREPNRAGVEFYRRVFQKCRECGIEPMVTLSHYELPYYLAKHYGGWANPELIGFYLNYAHTVMTEYKGSCATGSPSTRSTACSWEASATSWARASCRRATTSP